MSAMPPKYLAVVTPLVDKAREILESGESLQPFAFIGNFETGRILPVLIDTRDDRAKDGSVAAIRLAAEQTQAHFVFTIMEAWALPKDKLHRHGEIVQKYGSIGASPYRIDAATFVLETAYGTWLAQANLKPKGISKKKRTFGKVDFMFGDQLEGRFGGLLGAAAGDSTLH
jgi:hypothetical protein